MSATSYIITAGLLNSPAVPLEAEKFALLARSQNVLLACLEAEEAFELVMLNYISLENAMQAANLEHMLHRRRSRAAHDDIRREIDRQLVNLLATGEMYGAHVEKAVKRVERSRGSKKAAQRNGETAALAKAVLEERGRNLGARAVEKLRNHVLHRGLPVRAWSQNSEWMDRAEGISDLSRLRFTFRVSFSPSMLVDDWKVDPILLTDLEARADRAGLVDWMPLVREYVEALSYLQLKVREILDEAEAAALECIEAEIEVYRRKVGMKPESKGAMTAAEVGPDGKWLNRVGLDFDYRERIGDLRSKNRTAHVNLHRRELLG